MVLGQHCANGYNCRKWSVQFEKQSSEILSFINFNIIHRKLKTSRPTLFFQYVLKHLAGLGEELLVRQKVLAIAFQDK